MDDLVLSAPSCLRVPGPVRGLAGARMAACAFAAVLALLAGCASRPPSPPGEADAPPAAVFKAPPRELGRGLASWYGSEFHGRRTANGERFDMNELTAAHRTLPFGTRVRVRNALNGREVVIRINDRGPWITRRIIDLSRAAAAELDLLQAGEAPVVLLEP